MVSAVNAVSGGSSGSNGLPARRSPNLDAQLATCRAQLEDWVTCPSAKTPEGKAKIEQITTRFDAIKQQIKQADDTVARQRPAGPAAAQAMNRAASVYGPRGDDIRPPGVRLDVYA